MLTAMRRTSSLVMRLAAARHREHVAFPIDVGERLAALAVLQSQAKSGVVGFSPSGRENTPNRLLMLVVALSCAYAGWAVVRGC